LSQSQNYFFQLVFLFVCLHLASSFPHFFLPALWLVGYVMVLAVGCENCSSFLERTHKNTFLFLFASIHPSISIILRSPFFSSAAPRRLPSAAAAAVVYEKLEACCWPLAEFAAALLSLFFASLCIPIPIYIIMDNIKTRFSVVSVFTPQTHPLVRSLLVFHAFSTPILII
jgi:hypothetical protein